MNKRKSGTLLGNETFLIGCDREALDLFDDKSMWPVSFASLYIMAENTRARI